MPATYGRMSNHMPLRAQPLPTLIRFTVSRGKRGADSARALDKGSEIGQLPEATGAKTTGCEVHDQQQSGGKEAAPVSKGEGSKKGQEGQGQQHGLNHDP